MLVFEWESGVCVGEASSPEKVARKFAALFIDHAFFNEGPTAIPPDVKLALFDSTM